MYTGTISGQDMDLSEENVDNILLKKAVYKHGMSVMQEFVVVVCVGFLFVCFVCYD